MSWTNAEKDAWVMETIEYLVMMTAQVRKQLEKKIVGKLMEG